jgi:hypothetical protein
VPHVSTYVGLADHSEKTLAEALRAVADGHMDAPDIYHTCLLMAGWSDRHRERLAPVVERYGEDGLEEPERLHHDGLAGVREGQVGLVRDLQDLLVLATMVQSTWTVVLQAAEGLRDRELREIASGCSEETARQLTWLNTRLKATAPQALIVTP